MTSGKPHLAVFAGPTATILNTPPLVTSNKTRQGHGLPLLTDGSGVPLRFDALRPQRLAAPVTVYVEQFSAHPLEFDAADLYAPPDGYVDAEGRFSTARRNPSDKPVYAITLQPDDGLYPLPYMGRQASGLPWDGSGVSEGAGVDETRQTWFPDASRLFEEIDRFAIHRHSGTAGLLSSLASFDFHRAAPSAGPMRGEGSEQPGVDYFAYAPPHLRTEPSLPVLAHLTNIVSSVLAAEKYDGALWLEGTPTVEETLFWLHLVVDTTRPIVAHTAQHAFGAIGSDGPRNILKGIEYVRSHVWADEEGRDVVGAVLIADDRVYGARDVQKEDARTGGYTTTGYLGGALGSITDRTPVTLAVRPSRRHTHTSQVNLRRLPKITHGVRRSGARTVLVEIAVKEGSGGLLADSMPQVAITKYGSYRSRRWDEDHPMDDEVEVIARIDENLEEAPLSGFVCEGLAPYGIANRGLDAALRVAVYSGMPVVKVARGNAGGIVPSEGDVFILGQDLTATKARLLLMAALLRLGALDPARDPRSPTEEEQIRVRAQLSAYQDIFNSH